tara:strand:- start:469 stop:1563 length:1095 start_codon:yes stop_codon:yes gene_type:complete
MDFPILYGEATNGKCKEWTIKVEGTSTALIVRIHGYTDCKKTESKKEITKGKNIGKKNETTPFQQACSEAQSLWTKQVSKGYKEVKSETNSQESSIILPMLAHDFNKRGKDIKFPCWVQPKLDGVRCMVHTENHETIFTSRSGKVFENLIHLKTFGLADGMYLDGELYSDVLTFDEISGLTRKTKTRSDKEKHLEFRIFDMYDSKNRNMTTEQRMAHVKGLNSFNENVKLVPTFKANSKEEAMEYYQKFMNEGYEGIIFRNEGASYLPQYRSKDLQKYKEFQDDEFEIMGGKEAEGEDRGTVIFECKSESGTFWVRPRGSREYRKRLLADLANLTGKNLTVRYQNLTEYGEPRFPVGIAVRDYE